MMLGENIIICNPIWPYIPDYTYKILIIGGSGLGETNALLNLINHQLDIDKIYCPLPNCRGSGSRMVRRGVYTGFQIHSLGVGRGGEIWYLV